MATKELVLSMDKSLQSFQKELVRLRTGRASTALIESVMVDYYGTPTPITQVGNVTTPDARTIQVVPWEQNLAGAIEKAILAANVGLTPQSDGKIVRVPVPAMTEDRRKELVKQLKKMGEEAKIVMRNLRRDANELVKKQEKDKVITQDDLKRETDSIQKETDKKIAEIDKLVENKEKEILTV